jgi:hypothetical protein
MMIVQVTWASERTCDVHARCMCSRCPRAPALMHPKAQRRLGRTATPRASRTPHTLHSRHCGTGLRRACAETVWHECYRLGACLNPSSVLAMHGYAQSVHSAAGQALLHGRSMRADATVTRTYPQRHSFSAFAGMLRERAHACSPGLHCSARHISSSRESCHPQDQNIYPSTVHHSPLLHENFKTPRHISWDCTCVWTK